MWRTKGLVSKKLRISLVGEGLEAKKPINPVYKSKFL